MIFERNINFWNFFFLFSSSFLDRRFFFGRLLVQFTLNICLVVFLRLFANCDVMVGHGDSYHMSYMIHDSTTNFMTHTLSHKSIMNGLKLKFYL